MADNAENKDDLENTDLSTEGDDDFEAAFAEIANNKDNPSGEDILPDPDEVIPDNDNPDEDVIASKEEDPDKAKPAEDDPYAGMDDVTKARVVALEESNTALQHRIDSDGGRVSAFQRQVNDLRTEITDIRANTTEKPSDDQIKDAMKTDEGWKEFHKEYPEVATAIDARFDKQMEEVDGKLGKQADQVSSALAPVIKKQVDDEYEDGAAEVAEEFPSWQNTVKSKEWNDWLGTQPAAVRDITSKGDVTETISLFGMYDNHRIANNLDPLRKPDHSESDNDVVDDATSLEQKRELQLKAGVTLPSKSAGIDPDAESGSDFENAFNAYAKQRDAKRQA